MTYREKYFEYKKLDNKYINNSVIKSLLMDDGGFVDFTDLLKNFDKEVKDLNKLENNLHRVLKGEPIQYVLGYAYFVNSNYLVSSDVLIPRQETEQLAVATLSYIAKHFGRDPKITIVDVGTGSGVLAIYLKEYYPNAHVIGVDISPKALEIARKNAELHKVSVDFRLGNMLEPVNEKIDVLISNPPYIGSEESVDEQTLKYEPHLALFAEPKTKFYEDMLSNMNKMNDDFFMAFEIGEDMKDELTSIIESNYPGLGYKFEKDICLKDRFLYIMRNEELSSYEERVIVI